MGNPTEKSKVGGVTIATVKSREEARRITTRLEDAGIGCSLMDERAMAGGFDQTRVGGIKVQVDRNDVKRAVQLMGEKVGRDEVASPESRARLKSFRSWGRIAGWKLVAIVIAALLAFIGLLAPFFFC